MPDDQNEEISLLPIALDEPEAIIGRLAAIARRMKDKSVRWQRFARAIEQAEAELERLNRVHAAQATPEPPEAA